MSNARCCSQGVNDWRRVSTSPPAIGTGAAFAQQHVIVQVVGRQRLLEPVDVVVGQHLARCAAPICSPCGQKASLRAGIHHQQGSPAPTASRAARTIASSSREALRGRTAPSRS